MATSKAFSQQIVNEIVSYKNVCVEFSKSIGDICSPLYTFQTDTENSYFAQVVKDSINTSSAFVSELKRRRNSIKELIESNKAKKDYYWKIVKTHFVDVFDGFEMENYNLELQFNFYVDEYRSIIEKLSLLTVISDSDSDDEEIFYDLQ